MNKVFISHSSADKQEAKEFANALTALNIPYWLDEDSLLPGKNISAEIGRAIDDSSIIVFLLSKNSNDKSWQSTEIALSLSKGKRVFPLVITKEVKIPILLQQYLYLDISESRDFSKAAIELSKTIERDEADDDITELRLESLRAKREQIERQKAIYDTAYSLKESEMNGRNFSLLFISFCLSIAAILMSISSGIENINFIWTIFGVLVGAASVEIGHILRKRKEIRDKSKEAQQ